MIRSHFGSRSFALGGADFRFKLFLALGFFLKMGVKRNAGKGTSPKKKAKKETNCLKSSHKKVMKLDDKQATEEEITSIVPYKTEDSKAVAAIRKKNPSQGFLNVYDNVPVDPG